MKTLKPNKATSLLPNNSPEILQAFPGCGGTFQVVWIEPINAHALFFCWKEMVAMLATHHNGYSCHVLAQRMIAGDEKRALDQLDFIRECGGTGISATFVTNCMTQATPDAGKGTK